MINFKVVINIIKISIVFGQLSSYDSTFHFPEDDYSYDLDSECETSFKTLGRCKRVNDCPRGKFRLTRSDICYFEGNDPIVCCQRDISGFPILAPAKPSEKITQFINLPQVDQISSTSTDTSLVEPTNTAATVPLNPFAYPNEDIYRERVVKSKRIADKYCALPKNYTSHLGNMFFAGGVLSKPLDNPQMAAIGWRSFDGDFEWKCGGSLISRNFVITAAHCTTDGDQPAEVVRVGKIKLVKTDIFSQTFNITEIFVHPDYQGRLLYNDIALLKISPNASFTESVNPACLWTGSDVPVTKLIAMGYGTDAFAGKKTNELYEGNLTLVSNDDCRNAFKSNIQIPQGIIESQMCAKDPVGKADTCQGDSGGPLLFRSGQGIYANQHLVGITSFGESCAGPTPGVYTRVSSYIDWIESIVWPTGQF